MLLVGVLVSLARVCLLHRTRWFIHARDDSKEEEDEEATTEEEV